MGRLTIVIASIADLVLRAELYSILTASVHGDAQKRSNENIRIFPSFRKNSSNSWYFGLFFVNLIWASECFERFSADGAKLVQKSSFLRKDPLRDRRKGAILETIKNDFFLSTILFQSFIFMCCNFIKKQNPL